MSPPSDTADVAEARLTAVLYGVLQEVPYGVLDRVVHAHLGPVDRPHDPRAPWDACGVRDRGARQPDIEQACRRLALFLLYGVA